MSPACVTSLRVSPVAGEGKRPRIIHERNFLRGLAQCEAGRENVFRSRDRQGAEFFDVAPVDSFPTKSSGR